MTKSLPLGATFHAESGTAEFRVWAPRAQRITLRLMPFSGPQRELPMTPEPDGYFFLRAEAGLADRYAYILDDGKPLPDPVSRLLPEGVHGPTELVDPSAFEWSDTNWRGLPLAEYIIYELHVGTFTPQGTFKAAGEKLDYLKRLGVTVIELMPVNAFPGTRNWGYDGVSPYSVHAAYGGPNDLAAFVNAAHRAGMAVILDVVYNHLGNEGNYLPLFGPYFTEKHKTPWGGAINFDDAGSEHVRRYFVENACYWIREYHLDGLRLDAVQTIKDDSPMHILREVADNVHALAREVGRTVCVTAETDENIASMVAPPERGGLGLDAVWSDDFHHSLHALLTGERAGYYQDFGRAEQVARALKQGFVFQGEFFNYWNANRGTPVGNMALPAHIICIQNHDQIGNRAKGERLTALVPRGARKMAAALLLLAPHTPLLFMGQEYDEANPFQYFTNYSDAALAKATSEGRRREFKDFSWNEVPDCEAPATFERSRLNWELVNDDNEILRWYRRLLELRRELVTAGPRTARAETEGQTLTMRVPAESAGVMVQAALRAGSKLAPLPQGWRAALESNDDGFAVRVAVRG